VRILFLSTWFPYPPDNGAKLRSYHLMRALTQDHKVTLVSFAHDKAMPADAGDLPALCAGLHVVPLDPFGANKAGTLRTFLSSLPVASRPIPIMSRSIAEVSQDTPFDAVVASHEMMANYALESCPGAARILETHNSLIRWMQERYQNARRPSERLRTWASWRKHRRYEAGLFRRFCLVTVVSSADLDATTTAVGEGITRVEVVPNGVDCSFNRPGLAQPQPNSLVYNGSLTYSANRDAMAYFLDAIYPLVRRKVADVTLTITGSTAGVDLSTLPLDGTVRLSGRVPDIRPQVARAAVCVVPLREGGGTRLKILEAMALGTPVVSTTKGAEGLDVIHGEHLLLADEPERFARYTAELMSSPELRLHLTTNARRLVERAYDWGTIGRRFVSLVEEAVHGTRPAGA
jgi:glycosyltransferase involved in cell wall biosynthesis